MLLLSCFAEVDLHHFKLPITTKQGCTAVLQFFGKYVWINCWQAWTRSCALAFHVVLSPRLFFPGLLSMTYIATYQLLSERKLMPLDAHCHMGDKTLKEQRWGRALIVSRWQEKLTHHVWKNKEPWHFECFPNVAKSGFFRSKNSSVKNCFWY